MAIKFEDDKPAAPRKAAAKAAKPIPAAEAGPQPDGEAPEAAPSLPFAKPTRPDKKRKGR